MWHNSELMKRSDRSNLEMISGEGNKLQLMSQSATLQVVAASSLLRVWVV